MHRDTYYEVWFKEEGDDEAVCHSTSALTLGAAQEWRDSLVRGEAQLSAERPMRTDTRRYAVVKVVETRQEVL